ncbi:MAG TPA: methyltransferase, partial [Anaerolineales bacterium]|nr:methyltransferase [Anaerolineales bacterium]
RHEFWRIWGFVALLGLVCRNASAWFVEPLSVRQLVSWALLIASGVVAVAGARQLRAQGSPATGIEPTTALVTEGIYAQVRHPLYLSLLLLAAGIWLKDVAWGASGWAVAAAAAILATAWVEEGELVAQFGEAYRAYRRRVRAFIPGVV